jgi:diaminopropionate ammonia-lyase
MPSDQVEAPLALLAACPAHAQTPLSEVDGVLPDAVSLWVKDERPRMGLGSFKALGAAYVIAHEAQQTGAADLSTALAGRTYVTASAGNHGLSVAAGARIFGARAVVYLGAGVPESFAERLRDKGADVVREGDDYDASMQGAARAAQENGWTLLSDSSWAGYMDLPHRLMEGYLVMGAEAAQQMPQAPTHIFLQAGVGGLAGAMARMFRKIWGDAPQIIVVEPEFAPALYASIEAGAIVDTTGPESAMGRLDCKTPSAIALNGLAVDADAFMLITESEADAILSPLSKVDLSTSPSGGAGIAGALAMAADLPADARVLTILSETAA